LSDQAAPSRPLRFGEALPLAHLASNRNPRFALGSLGGRFVLACFIADVESDAAKAALAAIPLHPIDERERLCAIFVTDTRGSPQIDALNENRLIFKDAAAIEACGMLDPCEPAGRWILFDPTLRVAALWRLQDAERALKALEAAPSPNLHAGVPSHAPVLVAPRVLEPEFCTQLIAYYRQRGGQASGVTQQDDGGRTFITLDDAFKRRSDCLIEDATLREAIMQRI
jgi:hypothetical protein